MEITLTVNTNDPADIATARALLDQLGVNSQEPIPAREQVRSILKGRGKGRFSYVRLIAEASPEPALFADIVALFDSPKAVGGTHSSIERAWRAAGGNGMFITTDHDGDAFMEPDLAAITLDVLAELNPKE